MEEERTFSAMNYIKNFLHNWLAEQHLNKQHLNKTKSSTASSQLSLCRG
jgi:hypothetical protein